MDENSGVVTVRNLWLKKIWEIMSPMEGWPITLQCKHGKIYKIRPGNWFAKKKKYPIFGSMEHFLSALEEAIFKNQDTHNSEFKLKNGKTAPWSTCFAKNYSDFYRKEIELPRWADIKCQYNLWFYQLKKRGVRRQSDHHAFSETFGRS